MPPPQDLGYQLTLFGPRGADYARHITTCPPIFLDDAASLTDIVSQQKGFHISSDPLSRRSDTASKTFSKLSFQNGEF